MGNAHLHADAAYRIVPLPGGTSYGVEVIVAGTHPAMMIPFATQAAAKAWIVENKSRRSSISHG